MLLLEKKNSQDPALGKVQKSHLIFSRTTFSITGNSIIF